MKSVKTRLIGGTASRNPYFFVVLSFFPQILRLVWPRRERDFWKQNNFNRKPKVLFSLYRENPYIVNLNLQFRGKSSKKAQNLSCEPPVILLMIYQNKTEIALRKQLSAVNFRIL